MGGRIALTFFGSHPKWKLPVLPSYPSNKDGLQKMGYSNSAPVSRMASVDNQAIKRPVTENNILDRSRPNLIFAVSVRSRYKPVHLPAKRSVPNARYA